MWKHVRDRAGLSWSVLFSCCVAMSSSFHADEWRAINTTRCEMRAASGTSNHIESCLTIHFSSAVSFCHLILLYDSTSLTQLSLVFIFLTTTWRPLMDHRCTPTQSALVYALWSSFHSAFAKNRVVSQRKREHARYARSWRKTLFHEINLTSLQHDFLHLNDMWRKILLSFRLFLECKQRRGERRRRCKRSVNLTSEDDAHRLTVLSGNRDGRVGGTAVGGQSRVFWLRWTHRSAIKPGNCEWKIGIWSESVDMNTKTMNGDCQSTACGEASEWINT